MSEHWLDRLSEYIDGDLNAAEVAGLESHLAGCRECAAALEDLRSLVASAGLLPERAPGRDLWPDIAARLAPRTAEGVIPDVVPLGRARRAKRVALTIPQLVAAGIALVLLSSSGMWLALGQGRGPVEADRPQAVAPGSGPTGSLGLASWNAAVAELEVEFERRRPELEPETILVIERNLALVDDAITEARRALEADPGSGFLNGYMADAMRRKVDLLRQATRIQRTES